MSATFVAEILVSGVLAMTWLFLGLMAHLGVAPVTGFLASNPVGSTAILGIYAYALGVIVDRTWDRVTKPFDRAIRQREFPGDSEYQAIRSAVLADSERREFFDYLRSRIRIARSCSCTMPLIGITGLLAGFAGLEGIGREGRLFVLVASTAGTLAAWLAFADVTGAYYRELRKAGRHLAREAGEPAPGPR